MDIRPKNVTKLLIFVVIVGILVRLYNLTFQSIWFDESFSIYHSLQSAYHVITLNEFTPPLYLLMLHFWIKLFGSSPFASRLLSVLFGALSIPVIYLLGKALFNKKAGLYASIILSLSLFNIYYSQEARTYSMFGFFALLSMFYYLSYLKSTSKKHLVFYIITTSLLLYSHSFSILLVLAQNIYFCIKKGNKKEIKKWLLIQSTLFLVYMPWFLMLIRQMSLVKIPSSFSIINASSFIFAFMAGEFLTASGIILNIFYLFLLFYGLYIVITKLNKEKTKNESFILLLFWFILPIFITILYSMIISPLFLTKYLIFCSFPLYLFYGFVLTRLKTNFQSLSLIILILISFFAIYEQSNISAKDQWENIINNIWEIKEKVPIIINPQYNQIPFTYYFNSECFLDPDLYSCNKKLNIYPVEEIVKNTGLKIFNNNLIYITSNSSWGISNGFLDYLKENYYLAQQKEFINKRTSKWFDFIFQKFHFSVISKFEGKTTIYYFSKYPPG